MDSIIEKLENIAKQLDEIHDEIYRRRDFNDKVDFDVVSDVLSLYFGDVWEEMDEIIAQLKGERADDNN
jgi:hypothetical protein